MKIIIFAGLLFFAPLAGFAASTDYYLKIDGIDGESQPSRAGIAIPATTVATPTTTETGGTSPGSVAAPETGGTEASGGFIKIEDIKGETSEAKGKVEMEFKVEEGEKAMDDKGHKNEIDILSSDGTNENATNFALLLGGPDTSEERAQGLERAAEVILLGAQESGKPLESVSFNFEKIQVKLKEEVKLFGIIPLQTLASVEIDASEQATVKLPWWSFLAFGVEREEIGTGVVDTLKRVLAAKHDSVEQALSSTE